MSRGRCGTVAACTLTTVLVILAVAERPARAQHTEGCPIAKSDYGTEIQRTFTDSRGRKAEVFFKLPMDHDPSVPAGMLMYFHGNDLDPDDTYQPPFYEFQDRADAHGLIAAALKSIGRRTNPDGTVVREWLEIDERLLNDLLLSDIGGCFKLDRTRVYLEGASQGTCFLSAALNDFLWSDFKGGLIGLCGCWGTATFNYPVNVPTLRSRWKVFVENTTGDFLFDQGVMGLDIFKYNFGADVRADLARPGGHCEDMRVNAAAALDWMADGKAYTDPDANQPHWQVLDTTFNPLEEVAYDGKGGRFVVAVQRPDLGADVLAQIEKVRREMFNDDAQGFLDWRSANYPEYKTPPIQILTSADYGATFKQVARREIGASGADGLWDMTVAPDGSILAVVSLGLSKVNEMTGTIDPLAFPSMLIYGLDHDDAGNVFAHGAVIHLQRSRDSGATWSELTVPVRNDNKPCIVTTGGGTLAVIGSDGQVYTSSDGGDSFGKAALPAGTIVDFATYGQNLYAVLDDSTLRVSKNAGMAWSTATTIPGGAARAVEVLPNGDVVVAAGAVANDVGPAYRSKDAGQTWARERGAFNDGRMEFAGTNGGDPKMMMVTTRGILRYSTGALLDLGTPLPPLAGGSGGIAGAGSGGAGGGIGSGGTSGGAGSGGASGTGSGGISGTASGGTPAGGASGGPGTQPSGSKSGCGCTISPRRDDPLATALQVLGPLACLAVASARRGRRSWSKRQSDRRERV